MMADGKRQNDCILTAFDRVSHDRFRKMHLSNEIKTHGR